LDGVKLATKGAGGADEFGDGEGGGIAAGDFGVELFVDGLEVKGEALELDWRDPEGGLFGFLDPTESELVDVEAGALIPIVEGGGGHADFCGDFGYGDAQDAELDELFEDFGVMHMRGRVISYQLSVISYRLARFESWRIEVHFTPGFWGRADGMGKEGKEGCFWGFSVP